MTVNETIDRMYRDVATIARLIAEIDELREMIKGDDRTRLEELQWELNELRTPFWSFKKKIWIQSEKESR